MKKKKKSTTELQSCVKVEVAVLGSPSLIVCMGFVDVRQHLKKKKKWSTTEFRSCVKVEMAVLGSPSLTVLKISLDAKQH